MKDTTQYTPMDVVISELKHMAAADAMDANECADEGDGANGYIHIVRLMRTIRIINLLGVGARAEDEEDWEKGVTYIRNVYVGGERIVASDAGFVD